MGSKISTRDNVTNHYRLHQNLGTSASTTVRVGTRKSDDEEVAVKFIKKRFINTKQLDATVKKLRSLECDQLLHIEQIYLTHEEVVLVTEHMKGGALFDRIVLRGGFSENEAAKIIKQICLGVKYLQDEGVELSEIKPENLMFSDESINGLKMTNFGFGWNYIDRTFDFDSYAPGYLAPEILLHDKTTNATPCWSIGIILYTVLAGKPPFFGSTVREMVDSLSSQKIDLVDVKVSFEGLLLLKRCLHLDPSKRITCEEILELEWITKNCSTERKNTFELETERRKKERQKFRRVIGLIIHTNRLKRSMLTLLGD